MTEDPNLDFKIMSKLQVKPRQKHKYVLALAFEDRVEALSWAERIDARLNIQAAGMEEKSEPAVEVLWIRESHQGEGQVLGDSEMIAFVSDKQMVEDAEQAEQIFNGQRSLDIGMYSSELVGQGYSFNYEPSREFIDYMSAWIQQGIEVNPLGCEPGTYGTHLGRLRESFNVYLADMSVEYLQAKGTAGGKKFKLVLENHFKDQTATVYRKKNPYIHGLIVKKEFRGSSWYDFRAPLPGEVPQD